MAGAWWEKIGGLGEQADAALAALPQSKAENLFTISGGRVLMTAIIGEVTTVIETAANNLKLTATPTTGTARDICANRDIGTAPWQEGDVLGITGINTDAMIPAVSAGSVEGVTVPVVLQEGTLDWACDASKTGKIKWTMRYIAIDDGAQVVAS